MNKTKWTTDALRASVLSYIDMYDKQLKGQDFTKREYYCELHERFPVYSIKSFEFRMQNISYLFFLRGRAFVQGLKPRSHLGTTLALTLDHMIEEEFARRHQTPIEENSDSSEALELKFENDVQKHLHEDHDAPPPQGQRHPKLWHSSSHSFQRDPKVKAWVLAQANGRCEICHKEAPFYAASQQPYLEVHHVRHLSDGGADTIDNAVALCPNCHREIHYSDHIQQITDELYSSVSRLQK